MKGKRYKKNENKFKIKKKLSTLVFFVFVFTMIISGFKIFEWVKENKENSGIISEIQNKISIDDSIADIEKYNIDFEGLRQMNSDTIAWIKVNGTNIEYPVVKTTDNDYYLSHSFNKNHNSAGWVFMDYKDKFDGTDKNVVVYAHNRKDGSMFGSLKNILTEDWQNDESNFIISFINENEKAEYQVFSTYQIESEDYYITTNFETDDEFQKFIDTIKGRSVKDFGVDVKTDDNILTLSTCANNNKYRVVLHAKKLN